MRQLMRERWSGLTTVALGSLALLGACRDTLAPRPAETTGQERASAFVPAISAIRILGVKDSTYSFTVDPTRTNELDLGPNHLSLPANSICDLKTSGYGVATWNLPCTPQTQTLTITATVRGSSGQHPSIDFRPAMRFNPATKVNLYIYVPHANPADAMRWVMLYCQTAAQPGCVNEAWYDPELRTYVDMRANVVFRRIKHFSGYLVWNDQDPPPPSN